MKKLIFLTLMMFISRFVLADEIHLNNNTILKGTVIQVTGSTVEYDPDGPSTFDTIGRDQVTKIVYGNGKVEIFLLDTLYLDGGETVKCTVVRVTRESVIYRQDGIGEEKTVGRERVARIAFNDGRTVEMEKKSATGDKEAAAVKPSGGYHKSIFRFSLFAGGGLLEGGVVQKERRVLRAYKPDLFLSNVIPSSYLYQAGFVTGGADLDFMAPAFTFVQKRGFDFTGLKLGVKGRYGYEFGQSVIMSDMGMGDVRDSFYYGRLMDYHYWSAGPTLTFIFSPRNNIFNVMLNIYGTAGQVFNGKMSAMSPLRDSRWLTLRLAGQWNGVTNITPFMSWANLYTLSGINKTRVSGYTIRVGMGPEVSLNRYFPIVVGLHVTYAYTRLKLERALAIYFDGKKQEGHHEMGGELSVGLHF